MTEGGRAARGCTRTAGTHENAVAGDARVHAGGVSVHAGEVAVHAGDVAVHAGGGRLRPGLSQQASG